MGDILNRKIKELSNMHQNNVLNREIKELSKTHQNNGINIEKLQDMNDKMFKIAAILKRKQEEKELLTVQGYLLEDLAQDMRSILMKLNK